LIRSPDSPPTFVSGLPAYQQAAPREELLDLRLHGAQRIARSFGRVAHRLRRADARKPCSLLVDVAEELVGERLVDARLAAAIGHAADARDRVLDRFADRTVVGRCRNDDAVAVEHGLGECLCHRDGVVDRDRVGALLAEVCEHALGRSDDFGIAERVQLHLVAARQQLARVLEPLLDVSDRGEDVLHADAAVLVRVEQLHRSRVDVDVFGRHRERDPQLLVEIRQREQVKPVAK